MTHITYMPHPEDNDEVVVNGVKFTAYVPVEVTNVVQAEKLASNPWFTDGEPDPDRHAAWTKARDTKRAELLQIEHAIQHELTQ